jgi:hypothetical protein
MTEEYIKETQKIHTHHGHGDDIVDFIIVWIEHHVGETVDFGEGVIGIVDVVDGDQKEGVDQDKEEGTGGEAHELLAAFQGAGGKNDKFVIDKGKKQIDQDKGDNVEGDIELEKIECRSHLGEKGTRQLAVGIGCDIGKNIVINFSQQKEDVKSDGVSAYLFFRQVVLHRITGSCAPGWIRSAGRWRRGDANSALRKSWNYKRRNMKKYCVAPVQSAEYDPAQGRGKNANRNRKRVRNGRTLVGQVSIFWTR